MRLTNSTDGRYSPMMTSGQHQNQREFAGGYARRYDTMNIVHIF